MATSCQRAPVESPTPSFPPPPPAGETAGTVAIVTPPDAAGQRIFGGLRRHGRVAARGEADLSDGTCQIALQAMEAGQTLADGEYELWLTLNHDRYQSCFPSFGDWYIQVAWDLNDNTRSLRLTDPTLWQHHQLSTKTNRVTIHYHRYDEDYQDVGIWTWDGDHTRTPEFNELQPVGRDAFGLVFQLDRGAYGGPAGVERIGLVPRIAADWGRKDGDDRYWKPALGNEIYLISTRNRIWTQRPDISPHVAAAYIDSPTRVVVQLSTLVRDGAIAPAQVRIVDDQDHERIPVSTKIVKGDGEDKSNYFQAIVFEPLDVSHRTYRVSVTNFIGHGNAIPRGVLDYADLFADATAALGATYARAATTFRVFAPTAESVQVVIYDTATSRAGERLQPLTRAGKGIWEATVSGDLNGKFYAYRVAGPHLSADRDVVDIYAINTVDSTQRARITNLDETNPADWDRGRDGPRLASPTDMIIYEMHVRDFSISPDSGMRHKGQYLAFAEAGTHLPADPAVTTGLDHLVELGITHVQLLPVQDFDNDESSPDYNWGYVTEVFNSPEGWFASNRNDDSRVREFKQLVNALHQRGIGVIMDIVYNHTASNAPFNYLVPQYYFRFMPDGSYSNGSGCGNDFRTESPMGRKYVIDTLKYWVEEYGIDGFRFDLMALIDLDTMTELEAELRTINPDIVLYGEPWSAGYSPIKGKPTDKFTVRGTHIGAFNDGVRNALKGPPDGPDPGFIQNGSHREGVKHALEGSGRDWAPSPAHSINYMTCHDNLVLWDKLKLAKPHASDVEIIEMMKLGYLLLLTSQGIPFIHGGEEFARSKQGHHNSYNAPDDINQVTWTLKQKNQDLFHYVRKLIALRKRHPAFRIRSKEQVGAWTKFHPTTDANTILFTIDGSKVAGETWKHICIIANASDAMSIDLALPSGPWHVALDHKGAVTEERVVEGTVRARYKSGIVLYQP